MDDEILRAVEALADQAEFRWMPAPGRSRCTRPEGASPRGEYVVAYAVRHDPEDPGESDLWVMTERGVARPLGEGERLMLGDGR